MPNLRGCVINSPSWDAPTCRGLDGTAGGTQLVQDINPGPDNSFPDGLTNVDGTLFFSANNGANGTELYVLKTVVLESLVVSVAGTLDGNEEGELSGKFLVSQSGISASDTEIAFTVGGTATSGLDHALFSSTVTIRQGETSNTIVVRVHEDSLVEFTETVTLTLDNITAGNPGITIDPAGDSDAIDILSNDTARIEIDPGQAVSELGGAQTITVTLDTDDGSGGPATIGPGVTLTAHVVDALTGSATSGTDYAAPGTQLVSFLPGSVDGATRLVTLTVLDDIFVEPNETVDLELVNLNDDLDGQATLAAATPVTILDADFAFVVGRHTFYDNSVFDGSSGPTASDDAAIATDKDALLPGVLADFDNYTSYAAGINGIMVDITAGHLSLELTDFTFRTGNTADPSTWALADDPSHFDVRPGAGGSDRVTFIWDGTAGHVGTTNAWLEVTSLAAGIGLVTDDVFYFGNQIGEVNGDLLGTTTVTSADISLVATNFSPIPGSADVENHFDLNRSGAITSFDISMAASNFAPVPSGTLLLFTPPLTGSGSGSALGLLDIGGTGRSAALAATDFSTRPVTTDSDSDDLLLTTLAGVRRATIQGALDQALEELEERDDEESDDLAVALAS